MILWIIITDYKEKRIRERVNLAIHIAEPSMENLLRNHKEEIAREFPLICSKLGHEL